MQEFSVNAKETYPTGVFFRDDGLKMYTVGSSGDTVDEYNLGTAWNVTSATYLQEFSVNAKESVPQGVFFKPDGLKMYTVGSSGDTVDEYNLGTAWNVTSATYLQEFSVNAKETYPTGVFFRDDGLKMYTIGAITDTTVDEYNLGTAWNVTSATYLQEFDVNAKESSPMGVFFRDDGLKMYTVGSSGDTVDEYNLGTAWNVTSATYLQEFSVNAKESSPEGVFFKPDGLKMYTVGSGGATVDEYNLVNYSLRYSQNSTNSTSAGTNIMHRLYWTAYLGLSGYIFSFDNGTGTFVNDSWTAFTGTSNWSNVTKTVNSTVGVTIRWIVYANDTSNNWNTSLTYLYVTTVSDSTAPTITIISPENRTYATTTIDFNITLNEAGSWVGYSLDGAANVTMTNSFGNWNDQNASMTSGSHNVKFYANDSSGNMNVSSLVYFTMDLLPSISSISDSPDPVGYGNNVTINFTVTDDNATSAVFTEITYPNTTKINYTTNNVTTTNYQLNFSNTWQKGQYSYKIYANDSANQWSVSSANTFNVSINATFSLRTLNNSYPLNSQVNLTDPPSETSELIGINSVEPIISKVIDKDGNILSTTMFSSEDIVPVIIELENEPLQPYSKIADEESKTAFMTYVYDIFMDRKDAEIKVKNTILKEHVSDIQDEREQTIQSIKSIGSLDVGKIKYEYLFNGFTAKVKQADIEEIKKMKGIKNVWLDENVTIQSTVMPSVTQMNADDVWLQKDSNNKNITGVNITVAVIDTGIDYTHPDLGNCTQASFLAGSCGRVIWGWDYVNNDNNPIDDNGHGTHVAGIIGANGTLVGVAPDVTFLAYKVCNSGGSCPDSYIISAIENATLRGANVISISLGGSGYADSIFTTPIDNAVNNGTVVVVAAGNSGSSDDTVGTPASTLSAITVGAIDNSNVIASFSSRGYAYYSNGSIAGIKPDIVSYGVSINSTVPTGSCTYCKSSGYNSLSGTSMATPHVSGAVALLKQAYPEWTSKQIKSAIVNPAIDLGYDANTEGNGNVDALKSYNSSAFIKEVSAFLGVPYINDSETWSSSINFNLTNPTDAITTYNISVSNNYGANLSNTSITLSANQSIIFNLTLTVNNSNSNNGRLFGRVNISTTTVNITVPFSFKKNSYLLSLTTPNSVYTLTEDKTCLGTCFLINANNITIDGAGRTINYSTSSSGYGVDNSNGFDNITVKNTKIIHSNTLAKNAYAIYGVGMRYSTIQNNTIQTSGTLGYFSTPCCYGNSYGIYLSSSSNSNTITYNNITTFGSNGLGISLSSSDYNNISSNNISTYGSSGRGIYLDTSSYTTIQNNKINTTQTTDSYGIKLYSESSNNKILDNNITTSAHNGHALTITPVNLYYNAPDHNIITNNIIKATGTSAMGVYLIGYSNILENNTISATGSTGYPYAVNIYAGSNNTFIGGSISSTDNNTNNYAYRIASTNGVIFKNTNFTTQRRIYLDGSNSWFNYANNTDETSWLNASLNGQSGGFKRTLVTWTQNEMKWNDTNASGSFYVTYKLSGLLSNKQYQVWNASSGVYSNSYTLTTDSNGVLSAFNISLNGNTEVTVNTTDTLSPTITVVSPLNQSYINTWLWANVTLNEAGSWCGYSLDSGANQTMSNSSTTAWYYNASGLSEVSHNIKLYCNDTSGNMGSSNTVYFTVNTAGNVITSLNTSLSLVLNGNETIDLTKNAQTGVKLSRLKKGSTPIGNININFTGSFNWNDVLSDTGNYTKSGSTYGRSYLHIPTGHNEVINKTLYIPAIANTGEFYICTGASSFGMINESCPNITYYDHQTAVDGYYSINVSGSGGGETLTKSMINNTGTTSFNGYLLLKLQKNISGTWTDFKTIVNDTSSRNVTNGVALALDTIWYSAGAWTANETGEFRVYGHFADPNGNVLQDDNGTYLNDTYTFNVTDSTAPTITINAPADGTYFNRNWVLLNYTPTDDNNATLTCWHTLDSVETSDGIVSNNTAKTFNMTSLSEASHTVSAKCFDGTSNGTSSTNTFTVDLTAPTLNTPSPANNSYVTGSSTQTFSINVNDETSLNTSSGLLYEKFPAGEFYTSHAMSCTVSSCSYDLDMSSASDGDTWNYYFEINDTAGNTGANGTSLEPLHVTVDKATPTITISLPANTSYASTSRTLNYTATDSGAGVSECWYNYNGTNTTLSSCANATFTALDNQASTITVFANDTLGNLGSGNITFTIDTQAPTSNTLADATYNVSDSATIGWILQDNIGAGYYIVYRNGTTQNSSTAWTNNTNLNVWVNTSTVGMWNYTITFNDSIGNSGTQDTVLITINQSDADPPAITIQSPLNQTYNTTSIWFNITLSEAGSWAGFSLDGAANVTMSNSSGNWNALNSSMKKGTHTVKFFANDTAGNMNSTNVSFTIDLPNITLNSFALNDTYINFNESVLLTINASGSTDLSDFAIELQTSAGLKNATIPESWNSSTGIYTLIINATDLGNQSANATTINITNIYTLEGNYSAQVNTTSLNFSYGITALTIISYSPTDTYNDTAITVTAAYNTTESTAISSACNITRGGNNYAMTFSTNKYTGTIPTGALDGEYSFGVTCSNSAYQTQTNSSAGSFIVRIGQAGAGNGGSTSSVTQQTPSGGTWSVYSTADTLSALTKEYNITIDNKGNNNVTLNITTYKLGTFEPENSIIIVPAYGQYILKFANGNKPYEYFNGNILVSEIGGSKEEIVPLNIIGKSNTSGMNLEKIISDLVNSEINSPAFGWVAPKKVFNHQVYAPNWAVALIVAGLVYWSTGMGRNVASGDRAIAVILSVFMFAVALYLLVIIF